MNSFKLSRKTRFGWNDSAYRYNLRLLETRLKETYVIGRKLLEQFDDIVFEFAGQFDTADVVEKINHRFKLHFKNPFFAEDAPSDLLKALKRKININASMGMVEDEKYEDEDNEHVAQRKLDLFKNALSAVKQSITALERQQTLSEKTQETEISKFMKESLRLYLKEYESFERSKLKLKHLEAVWKSLDRLYSLQTRAWREIPGSVIDLYRANIIQKEMKTNMDQFIARFDLDQLWRFLRAYQGFLERVCQTVIPDAHSSTLQLYLQNVAGIDPDLIEHFPIEVKMVQAAQAYKFCAEKYQERFQRENAKEANEQRV